jgi:nucleoside phosphorylase
VSKILVTFALRQEGVSFERRLTQRTSGGRMVVGRLKSCEVGVTWLGMRLHDFKQFEGMLVNFRPAIVINSGFAGAVRTLLEPGDFLLAENFSSPEMVDRLVAAPVFDARGAFESVADVAEPADKMRINAAGTVLAVDMESARFSAICLERAVPFITARMISDRADETIPRVFLGKGLGGMKDISDAIGFAGRMIQLRPRLTDRLTRLIGEVCG